MSDSANLGEQRRLEDIQSRIRQLIAEQRFREALSIVELARQENGQDPWFATAQAYLVQSLGQFAKAAEVAKEAFRLGSDDPAAHLTLGAALQKLGQHEEAAAALLTAYRRMPTHAQAACALLEETTLAHGIDRARPLRAEIGRNVADLAIDDAWARLLFAEGLEAELPPGRIAAALSSVPKWLERAGRAPEWCGEPERMWFQDPPRNQAPDPAGVRTSYLGYVPYAATLHDVTIFHNSSIILTADGAALYDTAADERYGQYLDFYFDKLVLGRHGDRLLLNVGAYQIAELDAAVMFSGTASQHFGHWVLEFLSRLCYFEKHPQFRDLPIVVDAGMPPQHLEYLRLLVPNRLIVLQTGLGLRCKSLLVAGPATFFPTRMTVGHKIPDEHQGGLSVTAVRYLQERMLAAVPVPRDTGRKLYLSRRDRGGRKPTNDDALTAALTARGFETVFAETLSFRAQVELFRSASVVVAPNGSAMLNAIFSSTEMKLFILSQKQLFNWSTCYGLMREIGYDLTFVCSDDDIDQKHVDYTVPLDRLLALLDEADARDAR